jgi:hypothetical protein
MSHREIEVESSAEQRTCLRIEPRIENQFNNGPEFMEAITKRPQGRFFLASPQLVPQNSLNQLVDERNSPNKVSLPALIA